MIITLWYYFLLSIVLVTIKQPIPAMSQRTHAELLLEKLRQQRDTDLLCDMTITVGDVPFRAHRNVLAAFSQFFSSVSDPAQQDTILDPEVVSQQALESLLEFIYTGAMSIDR